MLAGVRAIAAALAMVSVSFVAAVAQIVPPSDLSPLFRNGNSLTTNATGYCVNYSHAELGS